MPALLTRMSIWPSAASASRDAGARGLVGLGKIGGEDMGALAKFGSERLSAGLARAGEQHRGALRMQARAMAPPIPPEAPVTSAFWPDRSNSAAGPRVASEVEPNDILSPIA